MYLKNWHKIYFKKLFLIKKLSSVQFFYFFAFENIYKEYIKEIFLNKLILVLFFKLISNDAHEIDWLVVYLFVEIRFLFLEKDSNGGIYLGVQSWALSKERAGDEPETVGDAELVFDDIRLGEAGMRVVPFVGREPGHDEEREADEEVGGQDVEPDFGSQGVHEWEEPRGLAGGNLAGRRQTIRPSPKNIFTF